MGDQGIQLVGGGWDKVIVYSNFIFIILINLKTLIMRGVKVVDKVKIKHGGSKKLQKCKFVFTLFVVGRDFRLIKFVK